MKSIFRNTTLLSVLIALVLATISLFQPAKTFAASLSGIAWPVDGSVSPWYIENGYYIYDHGCLIVGITTLNCSSPGIPAQLYGFDLVRSSSSATDNQHVYSPVNGTIGYATNGNYPGYAIGIQVDNTNLWVSLVHLTNLAVTSGHVTAGQYLGDIIQQDSTNNTHLHFNLFRLVSGVRIPVPFMNDTSNLYGGYDTHIIGCSQSRFIPSGILNWNNRTYNPPTGQTRQSIENQYGTLSTPINCGMHLITTTVNFTINLSGIGTNTSVGQNNNPHHPMRTAAIQIRNGSNQNVFTTNTTVTYSQSDGLYHGAVTFTLPGGPYLFLVKLSNTLNKQANNIFQAGGAVTEPTLLPLSGDVDGNNVLDILDYNDLMSCFGSKYSTCQFQQTADLNDDGAVDGIDYNIIIRSFSGQH